jgi:osmotically-inducible protein OsmY
MDDKTLRQDIIDELDFEPSVDSARIGVAVQDGVVTLTGHVPNYAQKAIAERTAQRIKGVRGIAEKLTVDFGAANPYSDEDIAKRCLDALDMNIVVPLAALKVKVQSGWVTLTGQVEWDFQRSAAVETLRQLRGVMGISNEVTVKPRASTIDIEQRIHSALKRHAEVEADAVKVTVKGGEVKLEGKVSTWADRYAVEHAAWAAPGVQSIDDRLVVA